MQAAVAELLDHAGVQSVALDDLHFADAATLELLSGLAAPFAARQWLFAHRPAEPRPAAKALRHMLTECLRLSVVTLSPSNERAAAELVDALAMQGLHGDALAPALVRHSGGNPLFLLETLKQGLLDGSLARGELPRPASVGALIEQRLQRLSEPALALARVAAIAGVDFSIELAEGAIGQSAVQLASAWRELQDAQMLRDEGLAHDLVADAVVRAVPQVVARRVHAAIAAWLQSRGLPAGRIVAHLWRAGQAAAAALQSLAAAKMAQAQGRAPETVALLDQALTVAGWSDANAQFEAARMRCEALWDLDLGPRLDAALACLLDRARTPPQRAEALLARLNSLYFRGAFAEAVDAASEAAAVAEQAGAGAVGLQVCMTRARALARTGRVAQGLALLRAAQGLLQGQEEVLPFEFHGALGVLMLQAGRLPEARVELQAALTLAPRVDRAIDVPNILSNIAGCDQLQGHAERALAGQQDVLRRAAASGNQGLSVQYAEMNVAIGLLDLNRYIDAWGWIERCAAALAGSAPAYLPMAGTLQARWYLELGQHGRTAGAFAAHPLPADAPPFVRAYRALVQAQVASAAGQPKAVRVALGEAVRAARASGRPNLQWETQLMALGLGCPEGVSPLDEIASAALALGMTAHAAVAQALLHNAEGAAALLDESSGVCPRWFYRGRVLAAVACGEPARRWLLQTAERQVPGEFRESFLHRQAVNLVLQRVSPPPIGR